MTQPDPGFLLYPYARHADQDGVARHPVVVVGGGPVGLTLALDLGRRGTPVVLLDAEEGPGAGSRAICFASRTLDIAHRLGVGEPMVDRGVVWSVGRVFHGGDEIYRFDVTPEGGRRNPAFINLQQPWFERFMFDGLRAARAAGAPIDIRGGNRVTALHDHGSHIALKIDTPDGAYTLEADWLVACDGARSPLRAMMGLGFEGRVFEDNFLIADVKMTADLPTERWFWFEPPFEGGGASALLHRQPGDIWRIDFQLGQDIDRKAELDPARIRARVDAMLSHRTGAVPDYDLDWTSIYRFQCRRMERFRHGAVLFAGDAAHQVSPFGARGANSGVQDAENLAWKLDLVVRGADAALLDTYEAERMVAADENILHSTRATDFLTPRPGAPRLFRDAVLALAGCHAFARPLVNSGRLSTPCVYDRMAGFGPDALDGPAISRPGAACPDAPCRDGFLLDRLGDGFALLALGCAAEEVTGAGVTATPVNLPDPDPTLRERYLGTAAQAVYLIRPDQHVVARWSVFDAGDVRAALLRSLARS